MNKELTIVKTYKDDYIQMWITSENFLYAVYNTGVELNTENIEDVINNRLKFQNGLTYPVIVDNSGVVYVSPEAKKKLNNKGFDGLKSCAIIVKQNKFMSLVTSAYLSLFPPRVPTQIFSSIEDAEKWTRKTWNKENS